MRQLVLIPTERERDIIEPLLTVGPGGIIETVGFGVIAAAVRTSLLIERHRPERVVLAGIAGLFPNHVSEQISVGSAIWFDSISIHGIGVGEADKHVDASTLGWNWFEADPSINGIQCERRHGAASANMLTVCAASANQQDADRRARLFPNSIGEEMESFSVAFACRTRDVPFFLLRGFSNLAGCRDHRNWQIDQALVAVAAELESFLDEGC